MREKKVAYMERRQALIEQSLQRRHDVAAAHLGSEQLRRYDEMLERERKSAQIGLKIWRASEDPADGR